LWTLGRDVKVQRQHIVVTIATKGEGRDAAVLVDRFMSDPHGHGEERGST
jgi:hypothetical protein